MVIDLTSIDLAEQGFSGAPVPELGTPRAAPATWARVRKAFLGHTPALVSLIVLIVIVLAGVLAPLIGRYDPTAAMLSSFEQPPSWQHWLGTDNAGYDVWARLVWGARVSLVVGFGAVIVGTLIGVIVGAVSGFYGGWIDGLFMRVTDAFLAFPSIVLLLVLAAVTKPSLINTVLVIAFQSWAGVARLVRGQFISLREQDWVRAARAIGAKDGRLIRRHILPHVISPLVVSATFGVGTAVLTEAGLSYLGLGVPPPTPSWGSMIAASLDPYSMKALPWTWLPPGLALLLLVLSVNYIGGTLDRALTSSARA